MYKFMVISFPVSSVFLEEENNKYKSFCVIVIVIQLIRKPITELKKKHRFIVLTEILTRVMSGPTFGLLIGNCIIKEKKIITNE